MIGRPTHRPQSPSELRPRAQLRPGRAEPARSCVRPLDLSSRVAPDQRCPPQNAWPDRRHSALRTVSLPGPSRACLSQIAVFRDLAPGTLHASQSGGGSNVNGTRGKRGGTGHDNRLASCPRRYCSRDYFSCPRYPGGRTQVEDSEGLRPLPNLPFLGRIAFSIDSPYCFGDGAGGLCSLAKDRAVGAPPHISRRKA